MKINCAKKILDLSEPVVMGILNTTPDSFSDGGKLYEGNALSVDIALTRAEKMLNEGAVIVDVGGESTRPGAEKISLQEEIDRVVPVVEKIVSTLDVIVSVDTSTPEVITESAKAGAGLINDVRALQKDNAINAAEQTGLPVCLMHMQGEPVTMQKDPHYDNVVEDVTGFLLQRVAACVDAGIARENIVLDPGFGFGKTLQHNLLLLKHLDRLAEEGYPVLVGLSRKSMIGKITGCEVGERLPGSIALALESVRRGASIVRVHDVKETVEALKVFQALEQLK